MSPDRRVTVGSTARQLYALGCGLGVLGSLVTAASVTLADGVASSVGISAGGATFVFVLCLRNTFDREDFDRDHSLGYRVGNLVGAVFVVVLGLSMLAIGVFTIGMVG